MSDDLIVGRTFGSLRALRALPTMSGQKTHVECACACGNIGPVRIDHLLSGHTTSCGCRVRAVLRERRLWARVNLRGQRRGRLVMLRPGPNVPSRSRYQPAGVTTWRCRCDCGREVNIPTRDLTRKRGPVTSCGCVYLKPAAPSNGAGTDGPRPELPIAEKRTSSAEALQQFHDEHSAIGRVRRICRPVDEDDEAGTVAHDFDPLK